MKDIIASNQQDARKLYTYVLEANGKTGPHQTDHSHAQLMLESMKEIDNLKDQVWLKKKRKKKKKEKKRDPSIN